MTDPGARPFLIAIERQSAAIDDGFTKVPGAWAPYTTAWARVRYGTGAERREAAQETASQAATFEIGWSPKVAATLPIDRIVVSGAKWDISSVITIGLNEEVHITAVKAA
jgi:head-tail adaptor